MLPLRIQQSQAPAEGVSANADILVSGIRAGDSLLAVARTRDGEGPEGLNPAEFTVSDGAIRHPSLDTSGYALGVLWSRGHPSA